MTRVNTNVLSLVAQRNLIAAGTAMSRSLERLSTGYRINRASDDPSGLVASERLRSEIVALDTAIGNATRAANIVGTAEGGLQEIGGLLLDIQGYVDEAANSGGMTDEEIAANQMLIDEAVASINRIAANTQFNGRKLLDGTAGYDTNGVEVAELSSVVVNQATFDGSQMAVSYNIDATTAEKAEVAMGAADIALADGTVTIQGNKGAGQVTFTAGMSQAEVIDAVNAASADTGVVAVADGGDIDFRSDEYGSSQLVSFTRVGGATFTLTADEDYGADATVTSVGGSAEGVSVEGLKVSVKRTNLDMEIVIADDTVVQAAGSFNIEQGGLTFQISAQINSTGQISMGIRSVDAAYLGDAVTGFLSSVTSGGDNDLASGNFSVAADVVETAIGQVSSLRGRLGAVQSNTLQTAVRSMGTALVHISGAESAIRDVDFAEETANLTRAQILLQSGLSALALANTGAANVLALLG